jgi:hypothetical protein
MKARTLTAVVAGFALGALAAFAVQLLRQNPDFDPTGYQPPSPQPGPTAQ